MICPVDAEKNKRGALIVATLVSFITPFMGSSVNIALPAISREFHLDAIELSWVQAVYMLSTAVFLVPFGRLADIYGRKKIFIIGISLFILFSFCVVFSSTPLMLIVFRALQGTGSAMIFGTSTAILTSIYPPGERGRALGITIASVYIGLSLGPFLGGMLTQYFGWRSIFWVIIPLGILLLVIVFLYLKGEWIDARGEKFDLTGSLVYCIGLVLMMYGFSKLPTPQGIWLASLGLTGLVFFIYRAMNIEHPVLDIKLFRYNRVFAYSNLAALINYSATAAIGFIMSIYLQNIKGFSPHHAGIIMISQPVCQALFSPFAGKLSDKIEPRIVASAGMGMIVIGLFLLTFISSTITIHYIILCLLFLGVGFALFSSPNSNAIMSSVDQRSMGVASGTLATMRMIGQMFSMSITIMILTLYIGNVKITPDCQPQFLIAAKIIFMVFAVLCVLGIWASLTRGKMRNK